MIPCRDRAKRFKLILVTMAASLVCLASLLSPYSLGNALYYKGKDGSSNAILDKTIQDVFGSAPDGYAEYYLRYSLEELGKTLKVNFSLTLISEAAKVPIYIAAEYLMGYGSIGASTTTLEDCGNLLGETAMWILNGAKAQDTSVIAVPTVQIIDSRLLWGWGSSDRLPKDTSYYDKEPTFWEEYRWWIIGSASLCVIETLLIVALSVQRARRKGIEVALAEKELRLREAQAIAHVGSFHWDVRSDEIIWSDELYRIYGLESGESEITYKTYLDQVHPDYREQVGRVVEHALTTRESFEHEYRIVRPTGETRWIFTHSRPIFDADGNLTGMQGVCQDITDRKRA
ncbi:MAG: PAS domain-containing protein, partial [Chloracidobacterium sp.]|nr:PAS domain-containing protein [Chloracidobacterium sp.]